MEDIGGRDGYTSVTTRLDVDYRCVRCRSCSDCRSGKKVQMEEFEEQLITRSGIRLVFMASKKKVRNRASDPSEVTVAYTTIY